MLLAVIGNRIVESEMVNEQEKLGRRGRVVYHSFWNTALPAFHIIYSQVLAGRAC